MKALLPTNTSPIRNLIMFLNNFRSHLKLQIIHFSQNSNILNLLLFRGILRSLYYSWSLKYAELFLWGFNFAFTFCKLGYFNSIKTAVSIVQPGWFLLKISKKSRLRESVVKQCTTLQAVWSLAESFSLMNLHTSAPLSPPFLCSSRCPVSGVKPWQVCKYISYVRYSLCGGVQQDLLKLIPMLKNCH